MRLSSPAFKHEGSIPSRHTCDGEGISPELRISDVPPGTKSLALIMDDPDAVQVVGKVWDHWVVFNIPPETALIPEGQEPVGVHGKGTSGSLGYHGPCPPDREHRYYFRLYALDTILELKEGSTKKEVEEAAKECALAVATLMGRYKRSK